MRDFRAVIYEKVFKVGPTVGAVHSNAPITPKKKKLPFGTRMVMKGGPGSDRYLAGSSFATRMILKAGKSISKFAVTISKLKQHPAGKAFNNLHDKYEPQIAKAFLNTVGKIKSQMDMKALAEAVTSKNIHHIVEITVGDKFEKYLSGEFKQIIFEAFHAGGLIGAEQLRKHPVKKGGPGSGRYPAGSKESYNDILARQKFAEGLKTAVREKDTGKVTQAESHKEAYYQANPAGGWGAIDQGFVDPSGQFHTREEVERKIGVLGESFSLGMFARGEKLDPDQWIDRYMRMNKGGLGSGRYPAGQRSSASDLFRSIMASQRIAEGSGRPAIRHDMTGQVFPAHGNELHNDIIDRVSEEMGGTTDFRDFTTGFVGQHGVFMPRAAAERNMRMAVGKALNGSLDITNPEAVAYLQDHLPELIKEINLQQQLAVQKILLAGINEGNDAPEIARQIRGVVGLTEKQAEWVENFRQQLISGENGNYTPIDERRLSATDRSMAQDEFDSEDTDMGTVDLLTDKYTFSLLNKRALDISVTEIHNASIAGQESLWSQAADLGYLDPAITRRNWGVTDDGKARDAHLQVPIDNPEGVGLEEDFDTEVGPVHAPGQSGVEEFDDNCRCFTFLTFDDQWGTGKAALAQEEEDAATE